MIEGRDTEVLLFEATLNLKMPDAPTDARIVYFHGPNGIGKSALMQHLHNEICPTVYERARAASADLTPWLARQARQGSNRMNAKQVAFAYLDFEHDGNGVECPMIGAVGLYAIARQLVKFNVVCPLFTVACFAHFKAWARATDKRDFALLRTEELKAINAIWEASGGDAVPGAKMVLALLDLLKKHGNRILDKVTGEEVLKKRIEAISRMDPAGELARHLPDLLAEDLNRAIDHELGPARIVLLFDSHDAFWRPIDLPGRPAYYHLHDEWLRRLLLGLNRNARISAVVAGRRKPLWAASPRYAIADTETQVHEIQGLTAAQAEQLLLARGLKRNEIESAIKEARAIGGPSGGIHPATLAAVASGQALPESPVDRLEWLVAQVYDAETRDALLVLSAFDRAFSEDEYFLAGELLRFATTRARLRALVHDEWFESAASAARPSYRLAGRVQRILAEVSKQLPSGRPNLWRDAHEAWRNHYDRVGDRKQAAVHERALASNPEEHDRTFYLGGP